MNEHIIEAIKERLDIGAKKYGEEINVNDGRDWATEATEELLDACVYLAAKLLQQKQEELNDSRSKDVS
tara:strand:- start:373 stop:579 length:207 start_codon:yes stop_codon:yes gene_type:complete